MPTICRSTTSAIAMVAETAAADLQTFAARGCIDPAAQRRLQGASLLLDELHDVLHGIEEPGIVDADVRVLRAFVDATFPLSEYYRCTFFAFHVIEQRYPRFLRMPEFLRDQRKVRLGESPREVATETAAFLTRLAAYAGSIDD